MASGGGGGGGVRLFAAKTIDFESSMEVHWYSRNPSALFKLIIQRTLSVSQGNMFWLDSAYKI